jgi:hypothetical protein
MCEMLKADSDPIHSTAAVDTDPYGERRVELRRMQALERIAAIDVDMKSIARLPTAAATFHRKKLLRIRDAARLEAGLVTPEQLQRENDPIARLDFTQARIIWQPRSRVCA